MRTSIFLGLVFIALKLGEYTQNEIKIICIFFCAFFIWDFVDSIVRWQKNS